MSGYTVQQPTASDLEDFAAAVAHLPFFSPQNDPLQLSERWRRALSEEDGLLAAYQSGKMLGLCWFLHSGTFVIGAYMRLIVVEPSQQSKGLGALLLAAFEKACSNTPGGCFVLTDVDNKAAQKFYLRHAYQVVGQLPGFAGPGRVDQILWKAKPQ